MDKKEETVEQSCVYPHGEYEDERQMRFLLEV